MESSWQHMNIQNLVSKDDNIIVVYILATVPLRKRCSKSLKKKEFEIICLQ